MLLATYKAMSEYLHAIAIPILNEAYYAGNVDFATTSNLHTLLGTMMEFLGTNGNPWAPPCDMRKIPTKVNYKIMLICFLSNNNNHKVYCLITNCIITNGFNIHVIKIFIYFLFVKI